MSQEWIARFSVQQGPTDEETAKPLPNRRERRAAARDAARAYNRARKATKR